MGEAEAIEIEAIVEMAAHLPAPPSADALRSLRRYLTEVISWNLRIGLISRRTPFSVLSRLVRQSAEMWSRVHSFGAAHSVADIGSGAGFPGIVCKLMSPEIELLLIERKQRKATFLERVATILQLENVQVVSGEAETAAQRSDIAGHFDVVTASAVAGPEVLAEVASQLLCLGGRFLTFRPQDASPVSAPGSGLELVDSHAMTDSQLLVYRRTG